MHESYLDSVDVRSMVGRCDGKYGSADYDGDKELEEE